MCEVGFRNQPRSHIRCVLGHILEYIHLHQYIRNIFRRLQRMILQDSELGPSLLGHRQYHLKKKKTFTLIGL